MLLDAKRPVLGADRNDEVLVRVKIPEGATDGLLQFMFKGPHLSSLVGRTAMERDFLLFIENIPRNADRLDELDGGMGTGTVVTPRTRSESPRVKRPWADDAETSLTCLREIDEPIHLTLTLLLQEEEDEEDS